MDQKAKRLWVDALRSGKYVQAQDALRVGDTHCVLGVLCDQYPDGKWTAPEDGDPKYKFNTGQTDEAQVYFLPKIVLNWAGIEGDLPGVTIDDEEVLLSALNDDDNNLSFLELADLIDWGF